MKAESYYYKARLFPTILTSIPFLIFVKQIITPIYAPSLKDISSALPALTSIGLYAGVVFLSVQINRFIAKEIFQQLFFKEEISMPSTEYLLWSNSFLAEETKTNLHTKILNDFEIPLLSKSSEAQDNLRARKVIVNAVSQVRNKLRENELLLQHNIEYGFMRNLIGGCLLAVIVSIVIYIVAMIKNYESLKVTGLILLIVYLLPILLSKLLVKRYGQYYAKTLLEQYLTK